jgi:hypothetical protein
MTRIDPLHHRLEGPGAEARLGRLRRRFARASLREGREPAFGSDAWRLRTLLGLIACLTAFALMAMVAADSIG